MSRVNEEEALPRIHTSHWRFLPDTCVVDAPEGTFFQSHPLLPLNTELQTVTPRDFLIILLKLANIGPKKWTAGKVVPSAPIKKRFL